MSYCIARFKIEHLFEYIEQPVNDVKITEYEASVDASYLELGRSVSLGTRKPLLTFDSIKCSRLDVPQYFAP